MTQLVVLGDLNLDILARLPGALSPGGESRGRVTVEPGGSAGTFARTAARAGLDVTFIGAVGQDLVGTLLEQSLTNAGIACRLRRVNAPSGAVLAIEQHDDRSMVCSRGANDGLVEEWVVQSWPDSSEHLHVSGYALLSRIQRAAASRAIALAASAGASISIDPPPASLIEAFGVRAFVDALPTNAWLFPNQSEGRLLTRQSEPADVVQRLRQAFPIGALTLAEDGALAWNHDTQHRCTLIPVTGVNPTGAGDVYAATFVARLLASEDLADANQAACAAAAVMLRSRRLAEAA